MKSILLADNRADLLATLEPILKHWGYRVLSTRNADQVSTFLKESEPCLLIAGEDMLVSLDRAIDAEARKKLTPGDTPIIARDRAILELKICMLCVGARTIDELQGAVLLRRRERDVR